MGDDPDAERDARITAEVEALCDENGQVPFGELLKLRNKWNKEVTFRGLDALQVCELRRLTASDYTAMRRDYERWASRSSQVSSYTVIFALAALGFVLFGWGVALGLAFTCWGLAYGALRLRYGHETGYKAGYEQGIHDGVNRALGISAEDDAAIDTLASQMEAAEEAAAQRKRRDA